MACRRLIELVIAATLLLAGCTDRPASTTAQTAIAATADRCVSLRPAPPFTGYRGALPTAHADVMTRC